MLNHNSIMDETTPLEFYLGQNYPNPFREKTLIKYCIAYRTRVILKIYTSYGKEIDKLVDEDQNPGTYEVEYSTVDEGPVASSQGKTLIYRLAAGNYKCEKKMILLK
jgi:hypothetical protein